MFNGKKCPYCSQHRPALIEAFESRRQQQHMYKDYELKSPKVVDEIDKINTKISSIRKTPRVIDEIDRINAKILSFCEEIVASCDRCSDSISNPYLGVFRKSHFDNIGILRRFCKTTGRNGENRVLFIQN
ncbi:hypothetical protein ES705_49861 [subsurface metagenome]